MFRSAIFKLTLWYVVIAAYLCLLFSVVVYHLSTEELSEALHHQYSSFLDNGHDRSNIPPPDSDIRQHGQHLLSELIWFNVAVIAGSSVIGYFLAHRTLKPIEDAHQFQMRFTAEASHELRTPLAAMRADTEATLMEKKLPAKTQRMLRNNLHDIERLEQLTEHLLDIARYQNKTTTNPVLLDFDELTHKVVSQLDYAAQQKHIRIKQSIQPAQIMGEQHGLQQLVTIVLDNAIKYSQKRSTVWVSLRSDTRDAILTVKDNGIGIPVDDLPHVFEHFYRSANIESDKKTMGGYGLGLALAREITNAHNGTINIQSRDNNGTTVCITLPLAHT